MSFIAYELKIVGLYLFFFLIKKNTSIQCPKINSNHGTRLSEHGRPSVIKLIVMQVKNIEKPDIVLT